MASFHHYVPFLFLLFILIFSSKSQSIFSPKKFVLTIHKDSGTSLHVTNIYKRTPPIKIPFVIDLNGEFLWVNCEEQYLSTTYNAPLCKSTQCSRAISQYCHKCSLVVRPGCHNNTCGVIATNPVTHQSAIGELAEDSLLIQSTQGSKLGLRVKIPQFLFACAPSLLLQNGLPKNVQGIAGLGHAPLAMPLQISSHFGFPPKFAMCLTSSKGNGVIFFGDGPYLMLPGIDVSHSLTYTPLVIGQEGEYYINVSSIMINNKPITKHGIGRAMISTTSPYTIIEHSIFRAITQSFGNELSGIPQVKPVAPFEVCYDSKMISSSRVGPIVPSVGLVLQNQSVVWRIFGANSMVEVRPGVMCLAIVDGGLRPRDSIVIGAYQLEDNLLQFDLARLMLGFSSSLLFQRTSCANFNFTSPNTP